LRGRSSRSSPRWVWPLPLSFYFAMGDRAADRLGTLKTWMVRNNATIMAVLIVIIAAKLIGDGISGLSS
jgi:hypothetical protein